MHKITTLFGIILFTSIFGISNIFTSSFMDYKAKIAKEKTTIQLIDIALTGNVENVKKFLNNKKVDINYSLAGNILYWITRATFYNQEEMIDLLIEKGSDVNSTGNTHDKNYTPLMNIICLRDIEEDSVKRILVKLLAAGAKIDAQDSDGNTALHHAARLSKFLICDYLIDSGARGDILNHHKLLPFNLSMINKDLKDFLFSHYRKNTGMTKKIYHWIIGCTTLFENRSI